MEASASMNNSQFYYWAIETLENWDTDIICLNKHYLFFKDK